MAEQEWPSNAWLTYADVTKRWGLQTDPKTRNYVAVTLPRAEVKALMAVRPLDLSNLLKHAFICGRVSAGAASSFHSDAWVEYDPTESAAYARILATLQERMK